MQATGCVLPDALVQHHEHLASQQVAMGGQVDQELGAPGNAPVFAVRHAVKESCAGFTGTNNLSQ